MKHSPLNEIIKTDVEEATQSLIVNTIEPWLFFKSHGVNIKKADGRSLSVSGIPYKDSAVVAFWEGFADAHINKQSRELIETTRLRAIERNIPLETALQDCLRHLKNMIVTIFEKMADVDQKLRGEGIPNSVSKKSIQQYIDRNYSIIKSLVDAEISCVQFRNNNQTWLKALELKPNIFGLGLNLNWFFSKIFRKK